MKKSLNEQPNATIYQYKHIKRVIIRNELVVSYILSILLLVAFQLLYYDMYGLFSALIGFAAVQVLHLIIILITFIQVHQATDRKWKWTIIPPWIGFIPSNDISFAVFRKVHNHVFWLGIILISILYPWLSTSLMISLITWHIWLLTPKLLLIFKLKKSAKKTRNGVIRIQNKDVNLLQP